jgi:hypothetical protein
MPIATVVIVPIWAFRRCRNMTTKYIIWGYGNTMDFPSLKKAEEVLHSSLRVTRDGRILNENKKCVGRFEEILYLVFLRWVCHQEILSKPVAVCLSHAKAKAIMAKLANVSCANDLEVTIVEVPLRDELEIDPAEEIAKWNQTMGWPQRLG